MRSWYAVSFMALLTGLLSGQAPKWASRDVRSAHYPATVYFTGYGISHVDKRRDRVAGEKVALDAARNNLIEKIQVHIQSESVSRLRESSTFSEDYASSTTVSTASLEVSGLESETFYNKRKKDWYARVWARKEHLVTAYQNKARDIIRGIEEHYAAGAQRETVGQPTRALAEYLLCYPLFDQLQESNNILTAVGALTLDGRVGDSPVVLSSKVTRGAVRRAVERLIDRPIHQTEDLAWSLAYQLGRQLDASGMAIMTTAFTFQDTRMSSPFGRYFQQIFDSKLMEVAGWDGISRTSSAAPGNPDQYILTGTYWERPGEVKLLASIRLGGNGKTVASAEAEVSMKVLEATQLDLKPQNFSAAFSDQKHFRMDEVIDGGLTVEAWTDRGAEGVVYTENETMKVYLRVNMPAYIRFIYHLADGSRTLLLDSHYIDETKVNKVYQIPDEFVCAEPFGAEVLQVFARTEPFDPVGTVEQYGYHFLKDDLPKFLAQTRGFKLKKPETMQAEKRVMITTLAKE